MVSDERLFIVANSMFNAEQIKCGEVVEMAKELLALRERVKVADELAEVSYSHVEEGCFSEGLTIEQGAPHFLEIHEKYRATSDASMGD